MMSTSRPRIVVRRAWLLAGAAIALVLLIAAVALRPPLVPAAAVERRPLVQRVVANGKVWVPSRIQLGVRIDGAVARLLTDEGRRVAAGDTLLVLDDAEARAERDRAAARLRALREVEAQAAHEELRQADISLEQALRRFERIAALHEGGAVPPEELDAAREARDLARSRRAVARARAEGLAPGGGEERLAAAELAAAEARLALTRLIAPASGVILKRRVAEGDAAQPGRVLLELAADGDVLLAVQPEERNLGLLREGQPALASADAYPDETFAASVVTIAPAVDAERGTIEVRLRVPVPPAYLRPDMTVSVDIEAARRDSALVAPADCVRAPDSDAPWVLAVRRGRTVKQPVALGLRGDGHIEIAGGVSEGDLLVPAASLRVRPGQRVRLERARPAGVDGGA